MKIAAAPRRGNDGFTLVSVIVAIVILSTGLLALARAQAMLVATQANTANRTTGLSIARGYTEVLRSRDPWAIVSEAATTVNAYGVVDGAGKYSRSTVVTVLAPNLLQVRIQVNYPRAATPLEITTLIYRSS